MTIRTCTDCGKTDAEVPFVPRRNLCKSCLSQQNRDDYASGLYPSRSYDGVFAASIKRLYGLSMADYDAMLKRQAHRCAICRRPESKRRRNGQLYRLGVDHDHVTMKPRGLLCHRCNAIVWALEENHTIIPAIMGYIEEFRSSFVS